MKKALMIISFLIATTSIASPGSGVRSILKTTCYNAVAKVKAEAKKECEKEGKVLFLFRIKSGRSLDGLTNCFHFNSSPPSMAVSKKGIARAVFSCMNNRREVACLKEASNDYREELWSEFLEDDYLNNSFDTPSVILERCRLAD